MTRSNSLKHDTAAGEGIKENSLPGEKSKQEATPSFVARNPQIYGFSKERRSIFNPKNVFNNTVDQRYKASHQCPMQTSCRNRSFGSSHCKQFNPNLQLDLWTSQTFSARRVKLIDFGDPPTFHFVPPETLGWIGRYFGSWFNTTLMNLRCTCFFLVPMLTS